MNEKQMKTSLKFLIIGILFSSACSSRQIQGMDFVQWKNAKPCTEQRISGAKWIEDHETKFLGQNQRAIEGLLGQAPRHELDKRGEKFFYYPITKGCDSLPDQSLQFRFDALARTKEILIVLD